MRAVVVGGGAAGLSAALAIRQAGWSCAVLEARRRGQASPRDVHVHRLSTAGAQALAVLAPAMVASTLTLDDLERDLLQAAEAAGADVRFGAAVVEVAPDGERWRVRDVDDGLHLADLLVDATGGRRGVLALLDSVLPDVFMDDLGAAESFVSWTGQADGGAKGMIPWDDPSRSLDGLIQVGPGGRATLTCRHPTGASTPSLAEVREAVRAALGSDNAGRMARMGFQGRGVRYTAPGVQRIALEEADLAGLPPFALVGDALLLAPPRFGEGLQRAFEQAMTVRDALLAGGATGLGARLAKDASRFWAGDGLAVACRAVRAAGASPPGIAPAADDFRPAEPQ